MSFVMPIIHQTSDFNTEEWDIISNIIDHKGQLNTHHTWRMLTSIPDKKFLISEIIFINILHYLYPLCFNTYFTYRIPYFSILDPFLNRTVQKKMYFSEQEQLYIDQISSEITQKIIHQFIELGEKKGDKC